MSRTRCMPLGIADVVAGTLMFLGLWFGLPSRWWPVDVLGSLVALALGAVGVALIVGFPWARWIARVVSWTVLVAGTSLVSLLSWTVAYLMGLYGPVGQGGAMILTVVAALLFPYLVVLPAMHIVVLRESKKPSL